MTGRAERTQKALEALRKAVDEVYDISRKLQRPLAFMENGKLVVKVPGPKVKQG